MANRHFSQSDQSSLQWDGRRYSQQNNQPTYSYPHSAAYHQINSGGSYQSDAAYPLHSPAYTAQEHPDPSVAHRMHHHSPMDPHASRHQRPSYAAQSYTHSGPPLHIQSASHVNMQPSPESYSPTYGDPYGVPQSPTHGHPRMRPRSHSQSLSPYPQHPSSHNMMLAHNMSHQHHPAHVPGMEDLSVGQEYDSYSSASSRPFACDQCALSFNRQHDLKRHKETHSGDKPFNCNGGCGKTFTRKDALKRHQIVKGCGKVDESWP